ncbi:hypothetical protein BJ912DRAFT_1061526 [Pholiota molesta]|nr:hypothetical protein BJ912DRAFT_1061526 [Pholiota molesta]
MLARTLLARNWSQTRACAALCFQAGSTAAGGRLPTTDRMVAPTDRLDVLEGPSIPPASICTASHYPTTTSSYCLISYLAWPPIRPNSTARDDTPASTANRGNQRSDAVAMEVAGKRHNINKHAHCGALIALRTAPPIPPVKPPSKHDPINFYTSFFALSPLLTCKLRCRSLRLRALSGLPLGCSPSPLQPTLHFAAAILPHFKHIDEYGGRLTSVACWPPARRLDDSSSRGRGTSRGAASPPSHPRDEREGRAAKLCAFVDAGQRHLRCVCSLACSQPLSPAIELARSRRQASSQPPPPRLLAAASSYQAAASKSRQPYRARSAEWPAGPSIYPERP